MIEIAEKNQWEIEDFLSLSQGKRAKKDVFLLADMFNFVNQIKRLKERAGIIWEEMEGLEIHWTRGTKKAKAYKWRSRQYFIDILCKNKKFYVKGCGWKVLHPAQNVEKTRFLALSESAKVKIEDTFLGMYI